MKNFCAKKRLSAPVTPFLTAALSILAVSCESVDQTFRGPEKEAVFVDMKTDLQSDISAEGVARMLSELPLSVSRMREVQDAVRSSSANGYDEEYPFSILFSSPGSGVGDDLLHTRSAVDYPEPLRNLLYASVPSTRSGAFAEALASSDLQIYWPYSEDWDGVSLPVVTFNPDGASLASGLEEGVNVGFMREQLPSGEWIVKEVLVDEKYAMSHPVWVVNRNEDSVYLTPQMLNALYPERSALARTKSYVDSKTLVLKEFKAHRNYDTWLAGGSEFFVKCGSLDGFSAKTEEELKLYSPSVTDLMISVKRKQVGSTLRFNTILVSEWTPQLDECVFLMNEDDGGRLTSWKANGKVMIKSKSYGFEVEIPLHRNDDLVWRGKLSGSYFEKYNGKPNRFGDVSVTFSFL